MIPVLVILGVGGLIAGVVVLAKRAEAERVAALRAAANRIGWTYRGTVPFETLPRLDRFELFRQGHSRKVTNVMTSPPGDPRAVLFDYSYTTGGGKSQSTHAQTVIYMASDGLMLPSFSLRPQNFFHGIAKVFGYQDIDVERRPVFSEMFLLRGEDEEAVRSAFSDAVMEHLERQSEICAAGVSNEVLYWRAGRRAGADQLEALVAEAFDFARRLSRGQGPD